MLRETVEIFKEIQATSSRTGKEDILRKHKDNDEFKYILEFLFNPFVILGIKDKKLNKFLKQAEGYRSKFSSLQECVEYLKINNTGRDSDCKLVADYLHAEYDEDLGQFLYEVITKKLKIGVTAKSINKAFEYQLIPEFSVQLAKKFEDEQHKIKGKKFVLTEKLDGMRVISIVENETVKFFSRQGQPILGLIEIEEEMKQLPDAVYDGELLIKNENEYKDRDVLQQTLKIARKDGDKIGLNYHLFDSLTYDEFENGKSKDNFINRKSNLQKLINNYCFEHVNYLPNLYEGNDLSVIPSFLNELESKGKEGLMLNLDVPYLTKRTDGLLKIKSFSEFDEIVLSVVEGEGKNKGKLGAVMVNYKGEYPLSIGSGFTNQEREYYFKHPEEIVGKVITVQFFRESTNQDGGLSVSFPVFVTVRNDKTESSYN